MHILCCVQSLAFLCSKKERKGKKIPAHFPGTSQSFRALNGNGNLVDLNIFGCLKNIYLLFALLWSGGWHTIVEQLYSNGDVEKRKKKKVKH